MSINLIAMRFLVFGIFFFAISKLCFFLQFYIYVKSVTCYSVSSNESRVDRYSPLKTKKKHEQRKEITMSLSLFVETSDVHAACTHVGFGFFVNLFSHLCTAPFLFFLSPSPFFRMLYAWPVSHWHICPEATYHTLNKFTVLIPIQTRTCYFCIFCVWWLMNYL